LKDSPVKLAKVDATIATELAKLYSVTGFPTIKFFKNGNPSDYDGGRTEKDIVNWVNKKTGPPAVTITNEEELLKLQESNDVLALGVFDNLESDAAKSFYSYAGTTSIETVFVITSSPEIKASLGLTQDAIVVLKNFDEKRNDYPIEGTVVTSSLDEFIGKASTPLVQNFTQASSKKIFGSSVKKHALLFFNKESDNSELMKTFTSVATTYNGQLLFITIDESNGGVLSYFGFTADQLPKLVVADMTSSMKKYPLDGELNVESITAHIEGFKEGTLKPTLKSEEPSPADLEDPVKVLKGKSFQDIVMNNKKDVMVEIYAPW
jgi:protein disulfide-isomerase A1